MFPNRKQQKCGGCLQTVEPGAGYCYKDPTGAWSVVCSSAACARQLGIKIQTNERKLTVDGVVETPYDPNAVPLIRSMPGAKWDAVSKVWRVSLKMSDRPRLLELADRLKLDVAPGLRVIVTAPDAQAAGQRAIAAKLYGFQVKGVEWIAPREHALLADDMGVGKTPQTLIALPEKARVIVVSPASLKYNWRDEAKRWRPDLTPVVLDGGGSFRIPKIGEIVILNYDILPEMFALKDTGQKTPKGKPIKRHTVRAEVETELSKCMLIVDEAQMCKNPKAARTTKVTTLRKMCATSWFLTGTPLMNQPQDLYAVLEAGGMAKDVFGSWMGFAKMFNAHQERVSKSRSIWVFGSPQPEVPERLRRVMLRRTKAEVLPDLPGKQYQTIVVNGIKKESQQQLDDLWVEWKDMVEAGELPPFSEFSKIREELAASRVPAVLETVERFEENETPLIVFSAHRAPIDSLEDRPGWATITGDTPAIARSETVRRFQAGELKGVALTIAAGGVGLTLTRASHVLFVDLAWRPSDNAQAEDRVCRIGQTAQKINVMRMVSDHVLDKHVLDLLAEKQMLIDRAIERTIKYTAPETSTRSPRFFEETQEDQAARKQSYVQAEENTKREQHTIQVRRILERQRERTEHPEAPLTPELREAIRGAYEHMLSVCDGAVERDGQGFSKPDVAIARILMAYDLDDDNAARALERMLSRYHRQLSGKWPQIWTKQHDDPQHAVH